MQAFEIPEKSRNICFAPDGPVKIRYSGKGRIHYKPSTQ
jgi:hypothetical protein